PESRAEERRLLYVAVTRAERVLRATWAQQRTFGGQVLNRRPSPWLSVIGTATASVRNADAPDPLVIDHVAAGRAALAGTGIDNPLGADPELLAALRTWRGEVARGGGVRPTVVLPDRALNAVATHLPRSADALEGLPGLGPLAAQRYGTRLLALVAEHAAAPIRPT
ncbi:MAG TPA: HRDC domain-containing protein, partial [Acidimicrobiales bacterium]